MKKLMAVLLSVCLLILAMPVYGWEEKEEITGKEAENNLITPGNYGGYTAGLKKTVNDIAEQYKFRGTGGHGFAAERANNLIDRIKGKNAQVVGDDNVKNGADRKIISRDGSVVLIQDKYYTDVKQGINACFEDGVFRYVDADGNPMQIEVPSDQYDDAVKLMAEKIKEGAVKGVTDPEEAKYLVRKGNITIQQAKNIARAGNIDSLKYDAANGIVSASCAFGISAVLNYAVLRANGCDHAEALKVSALEGVKTGGLVFATEVIVGQLVKTEGFTLFVPASEAVVRALGDDFANAVVAAAARGGNVVGQSAATYAAKVLRTQALTAGITLLLLSADDVCDLFAGRISSGQLIKNLSTATAGVVGGMVGWYGGSVLGSVVAPGAGTFVGGLGGSVALGSIAGWGTEKAMGLLIKDDAEEMVEIIQTDFQKLAEEYLADEKEADAVAVQLSESLNGDTLKDMFASEDRDLFARELMEPMFEEQISERETWEIPTESEMRSELKKELKDVVFIH